MTILGVNDATTANHNYGGEYREELERHAREQTCPFCEDQTLRPGLILFSYGGWWVKTLPENWRAKSLWPKKSPDAVEIPCQASFIIAPKRHITLAAEMVRHDWADMGLVFQWIGNTRKLPGGMLSYRFDHPLFSGKTVHHIHFQVNVPPLNSTPGTGPAADKQVLPVPIWVG